MDTVREALLAARLGSGRPLVAAVSGGADSMSLLEALCILAAEGACDVVAAHFNHGLRGADSDADESYVAAWCREHGVRCVTGDAGSRSGRGDGESPEGAARIARYEFLARVSADLGASAVATGHTLDDQAETVLLHLVRGAGLAGLRGMRPLGPVRVRRGAPTLVVWRPLLGLTRADTEAFCAARSIQPRLDVSNLDVSVPRNLVRRKALPLLAAINPSVARTLARFSAAAGDDLDFIARHADAAWAGVVQDSSPGSVSVSRAALRSLPPAIRRRVLIRMFEHVSGSAEGLALDHVEAMSALCDGRSGTSLDLPSGAAISVEYRRVTVAIAASTSAGDCPFPQPIAEPLELSVPGKVRLGAGFELSAGRVRAAGARTKGSAFEALLDASSTGAGFTVRRRQPGDLFQPNGMSQPKKLQDFFVDSKVPRTWRDRVPLVVSDAGIAWVAGYRVAEWAVARNGAPAISLKLRRATGS